MKSNDYNHCCKNPPIYHVTYSVAGQTSLWLICLEHVHKSAFKDNILLCEKIVQNPTTNSSSNNKIKKNYVKGKLS